jgi:hypothetical protein
MQENMEFPTEWVIVNRDDESPQSESPQNQVPPPSPPVDEKEEDSQVLQTYIVMAGG